VAKGYNARYVNQLSQILPAYISPLVKIKLTATLWTTPFELCMNSSLTLVSRRVCYFTDLLFVFNAYFYQVSTNKSTIYIYIGVTFHKNNTKKLKMLYNAFKETSLNGVHAPDLLNGKPEQILNTCIFIPPTATLTLHSLLHFSIFYTSVYTLLIRYSV
jgi:hypothetical protein